jgi:tellurite resistance-related uncharacterized protein
VQRRIVGFHCDDEGDWVAHLDCGHRKHVRHRPPFQDRPWVLDADSRVARLGTPLNCPLCDRAELPDDLVWVRTTPEWDRESLPRALTRGHRVAAGTWGRIAVKEGRLRFAARTEPPIDVVLVPRSTQPIPPEVEHEVHPLGPVRFSIDFLTVPRPREVGGEEPGLANRICVECGAITDDGYHHQSCPSQSEQQ